MPSNAKTFIYVFSATDRDTLISHGHEYLMETTTPRGTVYIFEADDGMEFDDIRYACSDTLPI